MGLIAGPALQYEFGGVDSRSNPVNLARNRSLRCRNWMPQQSGVLRLRDGYKEMKDTGTATAIHSFTDYKYSGTNYIIYVQGTAVKSLNLSSLAITSLGSMSSSANCTFTKSDGKLWIVNGTDQKYFDGVTLRDIGIRAGASTDVATAALQELLRQPQTSEYSGVTVAAAAGGSFPATTLGGHQFGMCYIDTAQSISFGPYVNISTRKTCTLNQKFDIATLPNLSAVNANWFKLITRTDDGSGIAKFCATAQKTISAFTSFAGGVMTATATGHGLSVGDVIEVNATGLDGVFTVLTTPDANTITYGDITHPTNTTIAAVTGTLFKLVSVANATTTVSVTGTLTGTLQANIDIGLAPSVFSGSTSAGYQIYLSLYNPTTGQIGNRIAVTGRCLPGTSGCRAIFYLSNLSTVPTNVNPEFVWLVGRTGDNSDVPYVVTDQAGNYRYSDVQTFVLRDAKIDTSAEMPTRNTKPSGLTQITKAADRIHGIKDDPYSYYTPAFVSNYIGKSDQSWPANNYVGFPTGENTVAVHEYAQQALEFTDNFVALLVDNAGSINFDGPWNYGIAGKRAFTKTPYGPYWLNKNKQLCTFENDGPVVVSDEYEKSLLGQISSTYLGAAELAYANDPDRDIDRIVIKGRDSNGTPVLIYHDFKLRDGRSPYGQGYDAVYQGQLNSDFTIAQIRDADGKLRIWAGGANGKFYQLDTTGKDDASNFDAEYIALVNEGENTEAIQAYLFYGDKNTAIKMSRELSCSSSSALTVLPNQQVGHMGQNYNFKAPRSTTGVYGPEYIGFFLTSHAADAGAGDYPSGTTTEPMTLSSVPHLPVEVYGRICAAGVVE